MKHTMLQPRHSGLLLSCCKISDQIILVVKDNFRGINFTKWCMPVTRRFEGTHPPEHRQEQEANSTNISDCL